MGICHPKVPPRFVQPNRQLPLTAACISKAKYNYKYFVNYAETVERKPVSTSWWPVRLFTTQQQVVVVDDDDNSSDDDDDGDDDDDDDDDDDSRTGFVTNTNAIPNIISDDDDNGDDDSDDNGD